MITGASCQSSVFSESRKTGDFADFVRILLRVFAGQLRIFVGQLRVRTFTVLGLRIFAYFLRIFCVFSFGAIFVIKSE